MDPGCCKCRPPARALRGAGDDTPPRPSPSTLVADAGRLPWACDNGRDVPVMSDVGVEEAGWSLGASTVASEPNTGFSATIEAFVPPPGVSCARSCTGTQCFTRSASVRGARFWPLCRRSEASPPSSPCPPEGFRPPVLLFPTSTFRANTARFACRLRAFACCRRLARSRPQQTQAHTNTSVVQHAMPTNTTARSLPNVSVRLTPNMVIPPLAALDGPVGSCCVPDLPGSDAAS